MHALLALTLLSAAPQDGPWMRALANTFVVLSVAEGDFDGNGTLESAVCYQDPADVVDGGGGVAILGDKGRRSLFHVRFERAYCDKASADKRTLNLVIKNRIRPKGGRLVWIYGRDFGFPGHPLHPLADVKITTSSMLEQPRPYVPQAAFDSNLGTTWAEGAAGTGIGETITVRFPEAYDVGFVGVWGGHGGGDRLYVDHNRLHRGSFDARSEADLGDESAGIDFSSLGIGVLGDRAEFSIDDEARVNFVKLDRREVRELELRIDSVYLGNRYDDTHIAELEIVPSLRLNETLDKAVPLRRKPGKTQAKPETLTDKKTRPKEAEPDAPLDALDALSGDLIPDEL